ncbi:MAG TPA: nickel-dependent lactate racemase [Tissierellia bacterium]|nr:nickel-dependent lactate racemase [Tissierellia bacterium]
MEWTFGYGTTQQKVEIPEQNVLGVLRANPMHHERIGSAAVAYAMEHPIGAARLRELVKPEQKIAIIASDISRPVPSWEILPIIVEELLTAGCQKENITVVFALGAHRPHTQKERRHLAGSVYDMVRCVDSDPMDCLHMGVTKHGTPVDITRAVASADFRICTGNIEYHYFAGYSGGVKALMPGVSTPEAIEKNHRLMMHDEARASILETNPVRMDIEEGGAICGADYLVNVILDEKKRIVHAVAGDVVRAHREGCKYLDKMYKIPISAPADIVIVSQGGWPKDVNLYQTQKALDHAGHAVKKGGTIILIGACQEGLGNKKFEQWLMEAKKPSDLIVRLQENFELGGHKAAAIAKILQRARVDLISEMEDDFVRSIFLHPQPNAQQAVDEALHRHGQDATVLAMPYGGATLPVIIDDASMQIVEGI